MCESTLAEMVVGDRHMQYTHTLSLYLSVAVRCCEKLAAGRWRWWWWCRHCNHRVSHLFELFEGRQDYETFLCCPCNIIMTSLLSNILCCMHVQYKVLCTCKPVMTISKSVVAHACENVGCAHAVHVQLLRIPK